MTIVLSTLLIGMFGTFPVERLKTSSLLYGMLSRLDSRIEMPVKAATSLKTMIRGMKRMGASMVRFLMRRGSALTISALVKR